MKNLLLIIHEFNYIICIILMMLGLFIIVNSYNLVKKLMGMTILQTSVLLFYISVSKVDDAAIPILQDGVTKYTNPLPHVLMLTAIVVGVATNAVGFALLVRLKKSYNTTNEDEILAIEHKHDSEKHND